MTYSQFRTPILFLVFNRPHTTQQVFEAIRQAQPSRLYIGADGARVSVPGEREKVMAVRDYIMGNIDWKCRVRTLFREKNLGCKRAVSEAISWFFDHETEGIILEDDCLPTSNLFEFCEWGLNEYRFCDAIGMISGSNLTDYLTESPFRNGFSRYINIWGWATWRDRWSNYDPWISLPDIRGLDAQLKTSRSLSGWERLFWRNVFKHTVAFSSTWDFYLQFLFFKNNLLSVYPTRNLVKNLGFGQEGTHTRTSAPDYWRRSLPQANESFMTLPKYDTMLANVDRDRLLTATIWHCTPLRAVRLSVMNAIRYMRI